MNADASSDAPRVVVRTLRLNDLKAIQALHRRVYPDLEPWSEANLRDHLNRFAEGQIGVELDGRLVATSSSLIVNSETVEDRHTFNDVCRDGFVHAHDANGDMLYGIDIAVEPGKRGMRLARRIYDARKELVVRKNLRGIVFGGRMPGYHKYAESVSATEYLAKVLRKEIRDPVILAQRANGFVVDGLLTDYLPKDKESRGYAVLMRWHNPNWVPTDMRSQPARTVRVAAVQYQMRSISSFDEFATQCEFFIDTASEYHCDFVLFPELLTNQLLALVPDERPAVSARKLDRFTQQYRDFFANMAIRYNINVIAGTHLTMERKTLYNIAYLFHRDGRVDRQAKLHITPSEARWWGVTAGKQLRVFDTDRGPVGISICYDVEFPEVARSLKEMGAELLFVPYNTDIESGHLRVRACAQARAIENHIYVITSGAVGNLPQVEGADIHYAQSAILTPSDIAFARGGVAAQATPNVETMLVHSLDLATLRRMEVMGTVRPWIDRRTDLYKVKFKPAKPGNEL